MISPIPPGTYAIGGCLTCLNLTFLTPERTTCLICGTPPDRILPMPDSPPLPVVLAAPVGEGGPDPDSGQAAVDEGEERTPTATQPAQPFHDAVAEDLIDYIMGEAMTADKLVDLLENLGVSHDNAVTASGRLAAIRAFLDEENARWLAERAGEPPTPTNDISIPSSASPEAAGGDPPPSPAASVPDPDQPN